MFITLTCADLTVAASTAVFSNRSWLQGGSFVILQSPRLSHRQSLIVALYVDASRQRDLNNHDALIADPCCCMHCCTVPCGVQQKPARYHIHGTLPTSAPASNYTQGHSQQCQLKVTTKIRHCMGSPGPLSSFQQAQKQSHLVHILTSTHFAGYTRAYCA